MDDHDRARAGCGLKVYRTIKDGELNAGDRGEKAPNEHWRESVGSEFLRVAGSPYVGRTNSNTIPGRASAAVGTSGRHLLVPLVSRAGSDFRGGTKEGVRALRPHPPARRRRAKRCTLSARLASGPARRARRS